ncbi:MAG: FKBP-type peptidyl-prolyl cis-trans isomerase [Crocinitomicaceae bacterium]|nr:FKBP-type peptidyl-prolyl cis-trans isomerase [Crocinitomicaceae bacterium]
MSEEINALSYCVGMSIAGSLLQQNLGTISVEAFSEALEDVLQGKDTKYTPEQANAIIQQYMEQTAQKQFVENKVAGEKFLSENFKKSGVQTTLSGLQYEVIKEGKGDHPTPASTVTVHYEGTLIDGTIFDSTVKRGTPATFGVNQVIPGWAEALQLMKKGSKYRLYIPQELAYGSHAPGGAIQPFMALIFDVELIDFK